MTGTRPLRAPEAPEGHARGFWALITTQFQGAFNDNLYRWTIVYYMLYVAADDGETNQSMLLTALGTILFAIPYLVFPGVAGALADRYSKRTVTVATKIWEVMVMVLGLYAFYHGNTVLIFFMLYLMFMQSAFFSPAKYGAIPELLPETRLSWGNGILAMTTFVAIIAGQAIAGLMFEGYKAGMLTLYTISGFLILLSLGGLVASLMVTKVPPAAPERPIPINPWSGLGKYFKLFYQDKLLWLTLCGGLFFWFAGALVNQNVVTYGRDSLQVSEFWISVLAASVMIGIAAGSMAAGHLSRRKIELGLVPIGIAGMAVTAVLLTIPLPAAGMYEVSLAWASAGVSVPGFSYWYGLFLLLGIGFFAGLYDVPLMATLQHRTPKDIRGGMIAAFNISTCMGIFLGGGLMLLCGMANMNAYHVFLITAVTSSAIVVYLCLAHPLYILRAALWLLGNTVYRVQPVGNENLPEHGGALLVANHTSFLDALVIMASVDRPIRFVMGEEAFEGRWFGWAARSTKAIPLPPPDQIDAAVAAEQVREAVAAGDLVCMHCAGRPGKDQDSPTYRGLFARAMKHIDGPVVPVHVDRLWAAALKMEGDALVRQSAWHVPYPARVSYGAPIAADTETADVLDAIQVLGTASYQLRKESQPLLHRQFIRTARRHPFAFAMGDARVPRLNFFKSLVGSIVFARKLNKLLGGEEMVGLLVPQSVGGALANIALQMMGKVAVNLNYTASAEAIEFAAKQCKMRQVLTSKEFLKRLPVEVPGEAIYLEDVKQSIKGVDRIVGMVLAVFCPAKLLERMLGAPKKRGPDDLATVIFSSGSEGQPKGVLLTHHNIISNIVSPLQVVPHQTLYKIMGILPFFHSFGFTGTLWLPLCRGMGVVFHPNPLEAKMVGQLAQEYEVQILIATPTFLQGYIRKCLPENFASLEFVITGAEKLPERIRNAFAEKFGIEPLEGYGTTECAPIVSLNIPDYEAPGMFIPGTKHGTIGKPIPGVSVRVTEPETAQPIKDKRPGILHIAGPNIMKGYLERPQKTVEVLQDGWYNTGDVGMVDEDGFITITDRVARFSKIGGEMVAHTRVEDEVHKILGVTDRVCAVSSVPDDRKGERLVVLHTMTEEQLEEVLEKMNSSALPPLWRPRANDYYRIEEFPLLGSGKLDLSTLKNLAKRLDVGS